MPRRAHTRGTPDLDQFRQQARAWRAAYRAEVSRVIWFQDHPAGARTRMLQAYDVPVRRSGPGRVTELEHCPAAGTFPAFASHPGHEGFAFLWDRAAAGLRDGPILVAVEDRQVVGALGPLSTMTDATGQPTVPPQYFAVRPRYQRRGHGRMLWRAAMAWGQRHQANYKIRQAQTGTAAEQLYLSEGLATLGFVCTRDI